MKMLRVSLPAGRASSYVPRTPRSLSQSIMAKRAGHTCLRPTLAKRAGHASAGQDEAPIPSIDSALQSVEAAAEGPLGQPKNETKAASQSVMASQLVDPTTKHIGILGGGQLGRMMALAAGNLGVRVSVLDPSNPAPAAVAAHQTVGSFANAKAIEEFVSGQSIDVLTVEIEHVDVDAIESAANKYGVQVLPSPATLRIIQDKLLQKQHFQGCNIPVSAFADVPDEGSLYDAGERFGYPMMLKSRRMAYDGRGNAVISGPDAALAAVDGLGGFERGLYVEAWVPYVKELAIMVARSSAGEVRSFPVVETVHQDSILVLTEAPAGISIEVAKKAKILAEEAVASLKGTGIFGVEMFLANGGDKMQVLLNEVAPRPHNSGHFTMDACETSQFEQVIRALLGWPLGSTGLLPRHAIMYNILGAADGVDGLATAQGIMARALQTPGSSLHWYDKDCMAKRKLGHINITAGSRSEVCKRLDKIVPGARKLLAGASAGQLPAEVAIIMGSDSDLPLMAPAARVLKDFGVSCSVTIVSAHRTPERMFEFARTAHTAGCKIIIAGAGGAAHLPGMVAAITPLPVIGVPCKPTGAYLDGVDALLSIAQMPRGVPVATVAIGNATNAGLLAVRMLGIKEPRFTGLMTTFQESQRSLVESRAAAIEEEGWEAFLDK